MIGAGGLIIMWHKNTIEIFSQDSSISEKYFGVSHGKSPAHIAG
jgi:hypothetical protein